MERPLVSIIIPFHRGSRGHDILMHVLHSCFAQSGCSFEILLVTNLPDPRLGELLQAIADPRIFIKCAGVKGVNAARNLGAKESRGDFLFFLDDDCVLSRAAHLTDVVDIFSRYPSYAVIGGPYLSGSKSSWRVRGYNAMASAWASMGTNASREVSPAVNLLGGNLCVKREIFGDFYFDDEIVSGGDETEFLRRLTAAGKRLGHSPSLGVIHLADGGWKCMVSRAWRQGRVGKEKETHTPQRTWGSFLLTLRREPRLLPFSLIHFLVLYLAKQAPDLARAIKKVRYHE